MNLKSVYKYQLDNFSKSILIYYLVIACVFGLIFFGIATSFVTIKMDFAESTNSGLNISGFEFASVVFLFVGGLNMFRETFRLSMQNGVSRKSIWSGTALSFLTVGGGMALIDTVTRLVGVNFASRYNVEFQGLYDLLCADRSAKNSMIQNAFEGFLLNFCFYMAALAIGYFITVGYYRMNKIAKIIVSIGVPGFYIFVLPFADVLLFKGALTNAIVKAILFAFGGTNGDNPYFAMGSGLLVSAIFLGLAYLMVRRAPIKD